jgi:hypothetical protein
VIGKFIIVLLRKAKDIYLNLKKLLSEYTMKQKRVVEIRPEVIKSSDANFIISS